MTNNAPVFTEDTAGGGIDANDVIHGMPWDTRNNNNGTQVGFFSPGELGAAPYDWVAAGSDTSVWSPLMDVRGYSHMYMMLYVHNLTGTGVDIRVDYRFYAPTPVRDRDVPLSALDSHLINEGNTWIPAFAAATGARQDGWINMTSSLIHPQWMLGFNVAFSSVVAITDLKLWFSVYAMTNKPQSA